jgi:O-antigen/teichoic acid export membrane protein
MKSLFRTITWIWQGHSSTSAIIQTFASKILILGTNIATGIITARFLGPEGRGEQAAMIIWPQFLAYTLTLGIPSALQYNLKRYPEQKSQLLSASLLMGSILGILATCIGIFFIPQWLSQYPSDVIRFAQYFMLVAPLSIISVTLNAALEAEGEFSLANGLRYLSPLLTFIVLIILVFNQKITPFTTSLAYLLPVVPATLWMLYLVREKIFLVWQDLIISCQRLMSYGLRSYGVDLVGTLSLQIGQVLVVGLLSSSSMGIYTVALSLSRMLNVFGDAIIRVLFPKVAARPRDEVLFITGRAARVSSFLTLLTAIPLILFGPWLLKLLYGSEFVESVTVFRILLLEVILNVIIWVLSQAFMGLGRPGILTILQGFGLLITVPLMLVLIPRFDFVGAGFSLLLSTLARLVFLLFCFPLILKVRPPDLIINKQDIMYLKEKILNRS